MTFLHKRPLPFILKVIKENETILLVIDNHQYIIFEAS